MNVHQEGHARKKELKAEERRIETETVFAYVYAKEVRLSEENVVLVEFLPQARRLQQKISEVLLQLSPREERIIRMLFGINLPRELDYPEIGKTLGVTGERVRQLSAKALRKLRHPDGKHYVRSEACEMTRWGYSSWLDVDVMQALHLL